ncbi:MAG TPA: M12 family metallo-peptidase, partial [Pyrinomonadaceae bacterium]|nr:M12 family metallo-peptidase [Pyrinomonadaceae bacterium]
MITAGSVSITRVSLVVLLFLLLVPCLFHPESSLAQERGISQTAWGTRGQAALSRMGSRLTEVAKRHHIAPDLLQNHLRNDSNLWLDEQENLLFLDEFVPEEIPGQYDRSLLGLQTLVPYNQTFLLHSLPGASKVIYLDFNGHTTTQTPWNTSFPSTITSGSFDLDGNASAFNNAEMDRVQLIWQRVAEDYLPFGVDVTTQDPGVEALRKSDSADGYYGVRVVISPTNWYNINAGGVAYVGSFNWNTDTPCFVFTGQLGSGHEKYTAEAISHEAGHTLGLLHDGKTDGTAYYQGQGNWASIMGVGYYKNIVQWSKGEYALANNLQNDLAVMTTNYGVTFRPDDHGDTTGSATPLTITNSTSV